MVTEIKGILVTERKNCQKGKRGNWDTWRSQMIVHAARATLVLNNQSAPAPSIAAHELIFWSLWTIFG